MKAAIRFVLVMMALCGGAYPLVLFAVGRTLFPGPAEGSLVRSPDGTVVGSRLLAQEFTRPGYFQPRPSAVGYDAAASGGSNAGPASPVYLREVRERVGGLLRRDGGEPAEIPAEMVTASGSGLDPHIPPAAARLQAARVAAARGVAIERVLPLVHQATERPLLGFIGRERVNVLLLNLALDAAFGGPAPAAAARP